MSRIDDLSGKKFNMLYVIKDSGKRSKSRGVYWVCRCNCGNIKLVEGRLLKTGNTKSCGCYHKSLEWQTSKKHGMSQTPTYRSWNSMIQRCRDEQNASYKNYGAKGIYVCDRWKIFENFLQDMGERPKNKTLDRINSSLGYSAENCRWANSKLQSANKKADGYSKNGKKWMARIMNLSGERIYLGAFATEQEAKNAYKIAKETKLKEAQLLG